jgi:hypothetical protein
MFCIMKIDDKEVVLKAEDMIAALQAACRV